MTRLPCVAGLTLVLKDHYLEDGNGLLREIRVGIDNSVATRILDSIEVRKNRL